MDVRKGTVLCWNIYKARTVRGRGHKAEAKCMRPSKSGLTINAHVDDRHSKYE